LNFDNLGSPVSNVNAQQH
jgi:hypothetical protein